MPLFNDRFHLSNQLFLIGHIQHILGSENLIGQTAESILHIEVALVGTENNADGRIVILVVDLVGIIVQVHIKLPNRLRHELCGFQLDQHIGTQDFVVEHHVHIVVVICKGHTLLSADEHKASSEFKQEFLDLCKSGEKFTNYEFVNNVVIANEKDRIYALEGYLFPDTYDFYYDASSETVINKMLARFNDVCYGGEDPLNEKLAAIGLSMDEAVALASVIEKEAVIKEDFYRVSAVFHNRMHIGMMLQSDAPLAYIFKSDKTTYTSEEMQTDSPYNTYVYKGVPIGAICNPGKLAIEAAIEPDTEYVRENYLYFCLTTHESGANVYAKTYEEHQENVAKYSPNW